MENKSNVERFLDHNFHDALLRSVSVVPPRTSRHHGTVMIILEDFETNGIIELKFISPSSFEFISDFDVLKDNAGFGNTSHTEADSDQERIIQYMRRIEGKTNTEYINMKSPVDRKIENVDRYNIFRIFFMGGTLEVIAEDVRIKRRRTTA